MKALKSERLRHTTELTERTSLMERDMEALKASVVAEKQVLLAARSLVRFIVTVTVPEKNSCRDKKSFSANVLVCVK